MNIFVPKRILHKKKAIFTQLLESPIPSHSPSGWSFAFSHCLPIFSQPGCQSATICATLKWSECHWKLRLEEGNPSPSSWSARTLVGCPLCQVKCREKASRDVGKKVHSPLMNFFSHLYQPLMNLCKLLIGSWRGRGATLSLWERPRRRGGCLRKGGDMRKMWERSDEMLLSTLLECLVALVQETKLNHSNYLKFWRQYTCMLTVQLLQQIVLLWIHCKS